MKKIIVTFVLFTLATAFNKTFATVMQEDSSEQKTEVTEENPLFIRGITSERDALFLKTDTKKKVTVKKVSQIGPFRQQWNKDVVDDGLSLVFGSLKYLFITSVLLYFCIFVAIIALIIYFIKSNRKRENQKLEVIKKCIETGQPIPEQLINDTNVKERYRKNGIMWLLIGIGIFILSGTLGILPICVGIAYIVLYFIEKNKNSLDE